MRRDGGGICAGVGSIPGVTEAFRITVGDEESNFAKFFTADLSGASAGAAAQQEGNGDSEGRVKEDRECAG